MPIFILENKDGIPRTKNYPHAQFQYRMGTFICGKSPKIKKTPIMDPNPLYL